MELAGSVPRSLLVDPCNLLRGRVGSSAVVESVRCVETSFVRNWEVDPPYANTTRADLAETAHVRGRHTLGHMSRDPGS